MRKQEIRYILTARDKLPTPERRAADKAIKLLQRRRPSTNTALSAIGLVIRASARGHSKRPQDRANDAARRVLVGARIPRKTAEIYRADADRLGISLYRWVSEALHQHHSLQVMQEKDPEWVAQWETRPHSWRADTME